MCELGRARTCQTSESCLAFPRHGETDPGAAAASDFKRRLKPEFLCPRFVRRELPQACFAVEGSSVYWQTHAQDSVLRQARWDLGACIQAIATIAACQRRSSKWLSGSGGVRVLLGMTYWLIWFWAQARYCFDLRNPAAEKASN
ncbi:unnamed protein product [Effrenium voratum]|nr:unnamed protein product [Effrenium voratum]